MTPMVDVVLQLLIFFMFTSQFAQITRTPMDLPEEAGEPQDTERPAAIVIDVQADGFMRVSGEPVDLDRLARMVEIEIARRGGDAALVDVMIRADRTAQATYLNRIAERLRAKGVTSWKLASTDPGPQR